jgi:hypothetical protein
MPSIFSVLIEAGHSLRNSSGNFTTLAAIRRARLLSAFQLEMGSADFCFRGQSGHDEFMSTHPKWAQK